MVPTFTRHVCAGQGVPAVKYTPSGDGVGRGATRNTVRHSATRVDAGYNPVVRAW